LQAVVTHARHPFILTPRLKTHILVSSSKSRSSWCAPSRPPGTAAAGLFAPKRLCDKEPAPRPCQNAGRSQKREERMEAKQRRPPTEEQRAAMRLEGWHQVHCVPPSFETRASLRQGRRSALPRVRSEHDSRPACSKRSRQAALR
jgi:hypothetical protein